MTSSVLERTRAALVPLRDRDGSITGHALVDPSDLDLVLRYRWHLSSGGYAASHRRGEHLYMHRLIQAPKPGLEVDHINRDRLDNRRANLRAVTRGQNANNIVGRGGTSEFRGVRFDKSMGRWCGQVKYAGRIYTTRTFATEAETASAVAELRAVVVDKVPDVNGILTRPKNGQQTHCQRGHAFDEENTKVRRDGWRMCRACDREKQRERYARRSAKNAGVRVIDGGAEAATG